MEQTQGKNLRMKKYYSNKAGSPVAALVTMDGMIVWYGLLFGDITLGCAGSRENPEPRFFRRKINTQTVCVLASARFFFLILFISSGFLMIFLICR